MDVLGDAVMKHVACRVTVDGTLPEASPVEAPLIQIGGIIPWSKQARGKVQQLVILRKVNLSVVLGLHREAQGASLSALPVGGLTWVALCPPSSA